jgi:hypothetical protein
MYVLRTVYGYVCNYLVLDATGNSYQLSENKNLEPTNVAPGGWSTPLAIQLSKPVSVF